MRQADETQNLNETVNVHPVIFNQGLCRLLGDVYCRTVTHLARATSQIVPFHTTLLFTLSWHIILPLNRRLPLPNRAIALGKCCDYICGGKSTIYEGGCGLGGVGKPAELKLDPQCELAFAKAVCDFHPRHPILLGDL